MNNENLTNQTQGSNTPITPVNNMTGQQVQPVLGNIPPSEDVSIKGFPQQPNTTNINASSGENKPKKGKKLLLIILSILVIFAALFCYNYFVRLSADNIIRYTVSTFNEIFETDDVKELDSVTTSGDLVFTIDLGEKQDYKINYDLGVDMSKLILYAGLNAEIGDSGKIDAIGYMKDNTLYFSLNGGNKVYFSKSDSLNVTGDTSSIDYNDDDIYYLINVFTKGVTENLNANNISRKLIFDKGLYVETKYEMDVDTQKELLLAGLNSILNDEKSLTILKDSFDTSEEDLNDTISYIESDNELFSEKITLTLNSEFITGSTTKIVVDGEENYYEIKFNSEDDIYVVANGAEFTIKIEDDKTTVSLKYEEKEETETSTLTGTIIIKSDDNKYSLAGSLVLKVTDSSNENNNMEVVAIVSNTTTLNGTVKSLNTNNAINIENISSDDLIELYGLLSPILVYALMF